MNALYATDPRGLDLDLVGTATLFSPSIYLHKRVSTCFTFLSHLPSSQNLKVCIVSPVRCRRSATDRSGVLTTTYRLFSSSSSNAPNFFSQLFWGLTDKYSPECLVLADVLIAAAVRGVFRVVLSLQYPIFSLSGMFRRSGAPFLRRLANLLHISPYSIVFYLLSCFVRECGADVDRCWFFFPFFYFISRWRMDGALRVCQCRITVSRNITGNIQHRASIIQSRSIHVLQKKKNPSIVSFSSKSLPPINAPHLVLSIFSMIMYSRPSSCNLPQGWHAHLVID
jgi:hypothetical protein